MGWTGDFHNSAAAATLLFDSQAFLCRFLRNLEVEQQPNGTVSPFIPSESSKFRGGLDRIARIEAESTGWASVTVPWTAHSHYGDRRVLTNQSERMKRWVDYMDEQARTRSSWRRWVWGGLGDPERYIFYSGFQWGEWLPAGETLFGQYTTCSSPACCGNRLLGSLVLSFPTDQCYS